MIFELLILTIVPSLFLLLYFVKSDKFPEPPSMILKTVVLGIIIGFPAGYLNSLIIKDINFSFLAAVVEEPLKFSVLYLYIKKQKYFDEPIDGIVYGACASLGFATFENLFYVFSHVESIEKSFVIAGLRSISAVPMHAMCGAIMGCHFGQYIFKKKKNQLFLSFFIPIIFHGIYNFSTTFDGIIYLFVVMIMIIYFFKIKKKFNV